MNKPYTRKIVLLSCIAVLLCVYIVQTVLSRRSGIKAMPLEAEVDSMTIQTAASEARLALKDGSWFVSRGEGQTEYEASQAIVDNMLSEVKDLKVLATASRSVGSDSARYGLDDASKIVVTAYSGQAPVRTLHVGKATSTNSQNYVQVDDDAAVYIVGSTMNRDFAKQCDDIRSKSIYSLGDGEKIESISCTAYPMDDAAGGTAEHFAFRREEAAVPATAETGSESMNVSKDSWILTEGNIEAGKELDNDKLSNWISSLSNLSASSWLADGSPVPDGYTLTGELSFTAGGKRYACKLYQGKEGEEDAFVMSCSQTPYLFKVASYMANRYSKRLSDFSK